MAVSCKTHQLNPTLLQANVTVRNTTSTSRPAVVYGPALEQVRYVHPVYKPVVVSLIVGNSRQSYVGFVIPAVSPKTPGRVLFQLSRPAHAESILAGTGRTVRADNWSVLDNPDCRIGKGK